MVSQIGNSLIDMLTPRIEFLIKSVFNNYYNSISASYSLAVLYNTGKSMQSVTPNIILEPKDSLEKMLITVTRLYLIITQTK